MNYVTIIWSAAASAAVLLAIVHLAVWLFDRQRHASLALAAASLSLVGVAITELGMMYSQTPEEWGRWVYWCHVPMFFLLVSILFFVRLYFETGRVWLMWTIIATRAFILVANLAAEPNFNFESIAAIRTIPFLGQQVTVVASAVTSRWQWFPTLTMICYLLFIADATHTLWRRKSAEARRKSIIVGGATLMFLLLSILSVHLVIWLQIQMPMVISGPYLLVILAMALDLAWDTLRATALARNLRESENRLELAANAAQLGLWTWDMQGNRIWATERARQLFGLQPGEDINLDRLQSLVHADDGSRLQIALKKAIDRREPYLTEFRVRIEGQSLRWIAAQGRIETDGNGRVTLLHGVLLDVTEQKKSQAEADELRREVSHSGRITMLGRLSSALAHELSQPLGAILRNVETAEILLARPDPDLGELRAIVRDIHKDDQRAGAIIDRLRSLLKRKQMQFQPLSVEALVNDASTLVRADATARHVALQCDAELALPMISGDRVHLSQVLINLIINGIDSICDSPSTRREIRIAAHAVRGSAVEITVSDSGPGIARDALPRLFEPFFTTKPSGMGMGLSVSRTIIEAHGGQLCAENQDQGGAMFRVTLPAVPA